MKIIIESFGIKDGFIVRGYKDFDLKQQVFWKIVEDKIELLESISTMIENLKG